MSHRIVIITVLESGARTIRQISASTGIKRKSVLARIHDLQVCGAVNAHDTLHAGKNGRPETIYKLKEAA